MSFLFLIGSIFNLTQCFFPLGDCFLKVTWEYDFSGIFCFRSVGIWYGSEYLGPFVRFCVCLILTTSYHYNCTFLHLSSSVRIGSKEHSNPALFFSLSARPPWKYLLIGFCRFHRSFWPLVNCWEFFSRIPFTNLRENHTRIDFHFKAFLLRSMRWRDGQDE